MRIVSLLENTTHREDIGAEHGLSLYIEANGYRILFDMGQTDLFARNAQSMGIDLSQVDLAILSHGHYDHAGGLLHFLDCNAHAPVYVHSAARGDYRHGEARYIGIDPSLKRHPRLIFGEGERVIGEGLTLLDCNDRPRLHDAGSFGLEEWIDGMLVPDRFLHEQYLLIEEAGRRVLISGCSHKGIADIVRWFEPDVLIGGFHLSTLEDEARLGEIADLLGSFSTRYYTCHCTGERQFAFLRERVKDLFYLSAGEEIQL